jgi:hypothetical protein
LEDERAVGEILKGAYDLHVHTSPDIFPRKLDDDTAAIHAREAGMSALVLKNHFFPTTARAKISSRRCGIRVIGSITLNQHVGGLNPHAVDAASREGAGVVWMPTIHSKSTVSSPEVVSMFETVVRKENGWIEVMRGDSLVRGAMEVLEVIRDHSMVLATGHLSPPESRALVKKAVEMGVERILLTHPFSSLVGMTVDEAEELLALSGGVFVEMTCFDFCEHIKHPLSMEKVKHIIRRLGTDRVILTSDGGQTYNPFPVEMLRSLLRELLAEFPAGEIRRMLVDNPEHLMG